MKTLIPTIFKGMMPRFFLLLFLLFSGCAHPPAHHGTDDTPLPPNTFRFSAYWGWSGGYSVKCAGKTVVLEQYVADGPGKAQRSTIHTFHPDKNHWDLFWSELTILGVSQWRK